MKLVKLSGCLVETIELGHNSLHSNLTVSVKKPFNGSNMYIVIAYYPKVLPHKILFDNCF